MEHHHHHHGHVAELNHVSRAFIIGIVLNSLFVLIEFGAGFYYNSLALISDSGHNLSDVASLVLALLAFRLAKIKSNETFTYGYRKSTVLASLVNAVVLLFVIGSITLESIQRLAHPQAVPGISIIIVAAIGIFINAVTAYFFFKDKDKDLNIRGAYLHLAADTLVSVGVVIGGIVIYYTQWFWVDPMVSLLIVAVIFYSTWGLLRESVILSLDGVPQGIDPEEVKSKILRVNGVEDVHHIHIWAISTRENALTAHLIMSEQEDLEGFPRIKQQIKHELEHLNIQHATLELEAANEPCEAGDC